MSDTPRQDAAQWPDVRKAPRPVSESYYEDEDYTAPVKQNDSAMIQMLSARARKSVR